MRTVETMIAIQEGRTARPWRCRIGLHDYHRTEWLLTTGIAHCSRCGAGMMLSIWGDFTMDRHDTLKHLRKALAAGAQSAETRSKAQSEGRQSGPQGNARKDEA